MNDRLRQALTWMVVAAIVFVGLLLLYYVADQVRPPTNPSRPDVSWLVLQTIVAFVLFDLTLLAGLIVARLGSWPAILSPRALLTIGAIMAFLSLGILVIVLDWPFALTILLWTLLLIAGFALLLSIANVWLVFREGSKPARPAPDTGTKEPVVEGFPAEPPAPPPAEPSSEDAGDSMADLIALFNGDRETAERAVALEKTLDPGASDREARARVASRLVHGQV